MGRLVAESLHAAFVDSDLRGFIPANSSVAGTRSARLNRVATNKADESLKQVHQRFQEMYANSHPTRGLLAFRLMLHAAGLNPSEVDDDWLRNLRKEWVYGQSEEPFWEDSLNRAYKDAVRSMLLA